MVANALSINVSVSLSVLGGSKCISVFNTLPTVNAFVHKCHLKQDCD